jgi:hypothetical protein
MTTETLSPLGFLRSHSSGVLLIAGIWLLWGAPASAASNSELQLALPDRSSGLHLGKRYDGCSPHFGWGHPCPAAEGVREGADLLKLRRPDHESVRPSSS